MTEEKTVTKGKVYVTSMNMRGKHAVVPGGVKVVYVTLIQSKGSLYRQVFSSINIDPFNDYKNYFWQAGKVFAGYEDSHSKMRQWWKARTRPRRRCPQSRSMSASHLAIDNKPRGYVESRKEVYVSLHYDKITSSPLIDELKRVLSYGISVDFKDFEGHRDTDGAPVCLQASLPLFSEKINDTSFSGT